MRNKRKLFLYALLLLAVLSVACGKKQEKKPVEEKTTKKAEEETFDEVIHAVFLGADLENKTATLQDVEDGIKYVLNYTGGTLIYNSSGGSITMEQLSLGELVEASFDYADSKLRKLQMVSGSWTFEEVGDLEIDRAGNRMKLYDSNYHFTDKLVIFSEGKQIGINELNEEDVLTVRGIGKNICSITVDRGHGYIVLQGYDNFVGGWVEVGQKIITQIKKDMILIAPEGDYVLTVEKNGFGGYKNITVKRDQETQVDVSDLKEAALKSGNVRFQITPEGATLLIAGSETDYSDLVVLDYGVYKIKVMADGYETYEANLTVDDLVKTQKIDLKKEGSEETSTAAAGNNTENHTTKSNSAQESTNSGTNSTSSSTEQESGEIYKIFVSDPEGAQVYLDGAYVGVAPVTFKKTSGSHTLTFRRSGYKTKSYTIKVDSENRDLTMAFPELEKSSDNKTSTESVLNDILFDTLFSN